MTRNTKTNKPTLLGNWFKNRQQSFEIQKLFGPIIAVFSGFALFAVQNVRFQRLFGGVALALGFALAVLSYLG